MNPSFSHFGFEFSITIKTMGMSHVTKSGPITMHQQMSIQ
jgi:hypothetical protein